jgi:hypothetical protein
MKYEMRLSDTCALLVTAENLSEAVYKSLLLLGAEEVGNKVGNTSTVSARDVQKAQTQEQEFTGPRC